MCPHFALQHFEEEIHSVVNLIIPLNVEEIVVDKAEEIYDEEFDEGLMDALQEQEAVGQ